MTKSRQHYDSDWDYLDSLLPEKEEPDYRLEQEAEPYYESY